MGNTHEDAVGLEQLRGQRARLANRLRAPWWYWAGVTVVMALMCAAPFGGHYLHWGGSWPVVAAAVVFFPLQVGLARACGVDIGTRTLRYRSGRAAGFALGVVVVWAWIGETLLLDRGRGSIAIVVGIVAVAAADVCWKAHLRGIRRDLQNAGGSTAA
jgi:hypothetical protein